MKTDKGFAPIAIFLIIVAILAVGGITYYVGKSSSPTSQNTVDNNYQPQGSQNSGQEISLPPASQGLNYGYQLSVIVTGTSGQLPPGIKVGELVHGCAPQAPNCNDRYYSIYGTPKSVGIYKFSVQSVENSIPFSQNYSLEVKTYSGKTTNETQLSTPPLSAKTNLSRCIPVDTKLSDIVDAKMISYNSQTHVYDIQKTTVEQKLNELKATCSNENKLVDATGKQITFYRLTGCWGNAPMSYQEILQKQQDEINKLKEQYTVIEMTCNPSGIPIP